MKNLYFINIIFLFSSFKLITSNCIPNENCLKERGECINNICECYDEFWTLKPNKENNLPNIFCNYEKRSRFLPLIIEFFLPGIGHLIMKKYLLGLIKIILWLTVTILFYSGYQSHKNENIEENNKNTEDKEEQTKLINKEKEKEKEKEDKNNNKYLQLQNKKELEELYNSSFEEDTDNNINLEKPYVANRVKVPIPLASKILTIFEFLFLICFFSLYIFDLFAYGFAFYKDGNGVAFL